MISWYPALVNYWWSWFRSITLWKVYCTEKKEWDIAWEAQYSKNVYIPATIVKANFHSDKERLYKSSSGSASYPQTTSIEPMQAYATIQWDNIFLAATLLEIRLTKKYNTSVCGTLIWLFQWILQIGFIYFLQIRYCVYSTSRWPHMVQLLMYCNYNLVRSLPCAFIRKTST